MSESAAGLAASRALRRAYGVYLAHRVKQSLLVLRDAVERKYNPNQPRVPAGNRDGGQWTDGAGRSGRPSQFARPSPGSNLDSDLPANDPERLVRVAQVDDPNVVTDVSPRPYYLPRNVQELSDVPKQPPSSSRAKNALIKFVTYRMIEIVAVRVALLGLARNAHREVVVRNVRRALLVRNVAKWIAEEHLPSMVSYYDPPRSLEELQNAAQEGRRAGYEIHHIVEQNSMRPGEKARINSRENLVRIPKFKHQRISDYFKNKAVEYQNQRPRDVLRDKDWDTRYRAGLKALREHGVLKP